MSLKLATACATCLPESSALYVSTGGKCVKTRVPSRPSHQKVWCGNGFVCDQEIFCVRNQREPESFTSCGSAAEYPNESGSHTSSVSIPNSSKKNRLPWTN